MRTSHFMHSKNENNQGTSSVLLTFEDISVTLWNRIKTQNKPSSSRGYCIFPMSLHARSTVCHTSNRFRNQLKEGKGANQTQNMPFIQITGHPHNEQKYRFQLGVRCSYQYTELSLTARSLKPFSSVRRIDEGDRDYVLVSFSMISLGLRQDVRAQNEDNVKEAAATGAVPLQTIHLAFHYCDVCGRGRPFSHATSKPFSFLWKFPVSTSTKANYSRERKAFYSRSNAILLFACEVLLERYPICKHGNHGSTSVRAQPCGTT